MRNFSNIPLSLSLVLLFNLFVVISGCADAGPGQAILGKERPARLFLPSDYSKDKEYPLVVLLHGYASNADRQSAYLGFAELIDERQFLLILPEGNTDSFGLQFWNATDGCCDFNKSAPKDAAYLIGLIDEAKKKYSVDTRRIYFTGHSNGSFMSYTMACEFGDKIAAIAALSGTTFLDPTKCKETGKVSVLHIHGTLDPTIRYKGADSNLTLNGYPGAESTVERWAKRNGCVEKRTREERLNLSTNLLGKETEMDYWVGCDGQTNVELWRIKGALHLPSLSSEYASLVLDFLFSQTK